ncbi:MAG: hypothetical protein HYU36_19245 [Planctomycetes bacterium]|nr:hypothetical protein [Planctomycetota bacterium]
MSRRPLEVGPGRFSIPVVAALPVLILFVSGLTWAKTPSEMTVEELEASYGKNPRDVEVALQLGVRYHHEMREAGRDGAYKVRQNRKKLDSLYQKSLKYLKRAQFMTQFAALPNVYIGSLTVLRGRDVSHSNRGLLVRWRGPKNFAEGPQMMDEAVDQDPENAAVRLVRIEDAESIVLRLTDGSDSTVEQKWVPRLDRFKVGRADLEYLIERCEKDTQLAEQWDTARLHLRAARLAERLGEYEAARKHLKASIDAGANAEAKDEARELLEKLPK